MSKASAKQRYTQLMEWLKTYGPAPKVKEKTAKFSKSDHYKKTRERYGYKKNN